MGDGAAHRPFAGVEHHLVDVAPAPVLARLKRSDDRVAGATEVSGSVLVRRAVAAAHMAAGHAESKMNPDGADLQAVFTTVGVGGDGADLIEMGTRGNHSVERTTRPIDDYRQASS